jgi:glycine cleavage system aminomethyltransferase T
VAHALTHGGKVYAEFTLTGMDNGRFLVITGSGVEHHDLRHMEQGRHSPMLKNYSLLGFLAQFLTG